MKMIPPSLDAAKPVFEVSDKGNFKPTPQLQKLTRIKALRVLMGTAALKRSNREVVS